MWLKKFSAVTSNVQCEHAYGSMLSHSWPLLMLAGRFCNIWGHEIPAVDLFIDSGCPFY